MTIETNTKLMQLLLNYRPEPQPPRNTIRASLVKNCIRQTFYLMTKVKPDDDYSDSIDKDKFVMAQGNAFEEYIGTLFTKLKISHRKLDLHDKEYNVSGTTDWIIELDNKEIITECKHTHADNYYLFYNNARKGIQPVDYYDQLQTYLSLYKPASYGIFIIGNRAWRRQDKYPPIFTQECQPSEEWWNTRFLPRIPLLNKCLETNEIPPREFTERYKFPCNQCQFNERCWVRDV